MITTYCDKISIGQRSLYAEWAGTGTPVIVLDGGGIGAGCWQGSWNTIWTERAGRARGVRYARASTGRSDRAAEPRTSQDMVDDLRLLLRAAGFNPPYLLVGHSFGGLNMQLFARQHPADVAGLVLLDSVHPDQIAAFYTVSQAAGDDLLVEIKDVLVGIDWPASAEQVRQAPALPAMPFVVITRGRDTPVAKAWNTLQADLAAQLPNSRQIVAVNSSHGIQFDEPQVVIAAITDVVKQLRGASLEA